MILLKLREPIKAMQVFVAREVVEAEEAVEVIFL